MTTCVPKSTNDSVQFLVLHRFFFVKHILPQAQTQPRHKEKNAQWIISKKKGS